MFCCNTKVAAINICFSVRVLVQSVVHNIHGTNYIFVFLPVVFPYGSVDTTGVKLVGLLDILMAITVVTAKMASAGPHASLHLAPDR